MNPPTGASSVIVIVAGDSAFLLVLEEYFTETNVNESVKTAEIAIKNKTLAFILFIFLVIYNFYFNGSPVPLPPPFSSVVGATSSSVHDEKVRPVIRISNEM
jgi:Na+/H+ antiporter NhaD/arsenite permease-like protein